MVSSYDLPKLVSISPLRIFKFSALEFTSKGMIQHNLNNFEVLQKSDKLVPYET